MSSEEQHTQTAKPESDASSLAVSREQEAPPTEGTTGEPPEELGSFQDARAAHQALADALGEDPSRVLQRRDVGEVLQRMQEGVVIRLHISRPRFTTRVTLEALGLAEGVESGLSDEAADVIAEYFQLGRRSFLPKLLRDRLARAEANARYLLHKYAFKTAWGLFIPVTLYQAWRTENEACEKEFWALKEEILDSFEQILTEVIEASRALAEDAWRRLTLGAATKQLDDLSSEVMGQLLTKLQTHANRQTFVERYLALLRHSLPAKDEVAQAFAYEVERSMIPLPSLLAKDMEQADRIYRERAIRDTATQAELARLQAQQDAELAQIRAEQEHLSAKQRTEREQQYLRLEAERLRHRQQLEAERERQAIQLEMERDVLDNARRQRDQVVRQFYIEVVAQMNELLNETCSSVLESMQENHGQLRGPVSTQLRQMVRQLERLNFLGDEQIERQLEALRAVLPTDAERQKAQNKQGTIRLDTSRIQQVVRAVNTEAEGLLLSLGNRSQVRGQRRVQTPLSEEGLLPLRGARRQVRHGLPVIEPSEEAPQTAKKLPRKRRRSVAVE